MNMATRNYRETLAQLDELEQHIAPSDRDSWQDLAICAQTDSEAFFPEKGGTTRPAKLICSQCPVRAKQLGGSGECLDYALEHDERFGIWGGYSERERRRMKRGQDITPKRETHCSRGHAMPPAGHCKKCAHGRRQGIYQAGI